MWTFSCYDAGTEPNLWREWYDDNPACQGSHDSVFDILEQRAPWAEPHAKKLGDDVIEVRLSGSDRTEWRIFGCYHGKLHFVVVAIGFHKGRVYSPKDIKNTAQKRVAGIKSGAIGIKACERPQ